MYQARYIRMDGSAGAEVALPPALFDGVIHEGALHQAVTAYLANQRQGTVQRKNRSAVAGGSRKPWRQKGTGRARQGTIRAAQWRGGGIAFPPQSRSWTRRVPKRIRALARSSAFNSRAAEGRVAVIEGFDFEEPRTRKLTQLLAAIAGEGKILFLTNGVNRELYLSGRNLAGVRVLPFGQESSFDVVWAGTVIIEEAALAAIADVQRPDDRPRRRPLAGAGATAADGENQEEG
ncbi:MAG: 50S ribosomal protein L4 [Gemmatimonadetes bacterium]|nr:50S ribosomal protein L4 [Gemmatimonadota bacterium]MYA11419.1 50S ribosomal protein L4 [Gemmatimonadota bacterium]MYD15463.1 50S ribosomal protein L4 [Gemmatimonadota bacterium]MYE69343.1 50S ribosomal protein L4 [Gemmatimonadota bacterium]MYI66345.1 50S ribosomal protein L4 [Gemmatimonadota bacterium]